MSLREARAGSPACNVQSRRRWGLLGAAASRGGDAVEFTARPQPLQVLRPATTTTTRQSKVGGAMRAHAGKTYSRRAPVSSEAGSENPVPPASPKRPTPAAASKPTLRPSPTRPLLERSANSASASVVAGSGPADTAVRGAHIRASSLTSASTRPPPVALNRPRRRATLRPIDYAEPTEDDIPRRPSSLHPSPAPAPSSLAQKGIDHASETLAKASSAVSTPRHPRTRVSSFAKNPARSCASAPHEPSPPNDPQTLQDDAHTEAGPSCTNQPQVGAPRRSSSLRGTKPTTASRSLPRASSRLLRSGTPESVALESGVSALRLSDEAGAPQRRVSHSKSHSHSYSHSHPNPPRRKQASAPVHLVPLLEACGQARVLDFTRYIQGFEMDLVKIGEASYSEVFATLDRGQLRTVLKVIPLRAPDSLRGDGSGDGSGGGDGGSADAEDLPEQTDLEDALREVRVTNLLNLVRPLGPSYFSSKSSADADATPTGQFVDLLGARVVRGAYPAALMDCWRAYRDASADEALNASPGTFLSVSAS